MRAYVRKSRNESLCDTCTHGQRTDAADGEIARWCHNIYPTVRVPRVVSECSGYDFRYSDIPHSMKEVAWVIDVNKKAQFVGFRPPKPKKDDDVF